MAKLQLKLIEKKSLDISNEQRTMRTPLRQEMKLKVERKFKRKTFQN